jgi:o-succinylbenzoate---CoA ligase
MVRGFAARVPAVRAAGQWWSSDAVGERAHGWLSSLGDVVVGERPCAGAVPADVDGVALFVALSARPGPAIVLSHDPAGWPSRSSLFEGLPLALPPRLHSLADEATRRGFIPVRLGTEARAQRSVPFVPLCTDGFVVFTSGSTGAPKPVYRLAKRIAAGAAARNTALGLTHGDGIVGGVPPSSGQGVVQIVTAMGLGGPLGMLAPRDHRDALATLADPRFTCWRATPHYADVLGRCALAGAPRVPPVCVMSSPVARDVFDRFVLRFGVPLRQTYSSSETGVVTVDGGPPDTVVFGTVGHPVTGVEVRVGESLQEPARTGVPAPLWVRSPWLMSGYGVPPHVEGATLDEGWWRTPDRGSVDGTGRLTLAGRTDDRVRSRDGRLVDLAYVSERLAAVAGIVAAVALPVQSPSGTLVGAVIEVADGAGLDVLRPRIAAALPGWALPRHTVIVPELPRLATGKPDRLACLALLSRDPSGH